MGRSRATPALNPSKFATFFSHYLGHDISHDMTARLSAMRAPAMMTAL